MKLKYSFRIFKINSSGVPIAENKLHFQTLGMAMKWLDVNAEEGWEYIVIPTYYAADKSGKMDWVEFEQHHN